MLQQNWKEILFIFQNSLIFLYIYNMHWNISHVGRVFPNLWIFIFLVNKIKIKFYCEVMRQLSITIGCQVQFTKVQLYSFISKQLGYLVKKLINFIALSGNGTKSSPRIYQNSISFQLFLHTALSHPFIP